MPTKLIHISIAAAFAISLVIGIQIQFRSFEDLQGLNVPEDHGWAPPEDSLEIEELFGQDAPEVPSGRGKVRLLYKDWEKATGYPYIPRRQSAPDCVGHSMAGGLDIRMAVQAVESVYRSPEYASSAPPIYGLSRIEIAGKTSTAGGGSRVRWAMQAMEDYGVLFKKNYLYTGYDLTKYDPSRSRTWGSTGLPSPLEEVAKLTPMAEYYKVSSYQEVRDAIANGYPVVVGSNIGFSRRTIFSWGNTKATRDRDGFLRSNGRWNHAMVFVGVDDRSRRKGICCLNSWGSSWVNGPEKLDQPNGSFWIDDETVTEMVQQGDAFAIIQINSPLDYRLTR